SEFKDSNIIIFKEITKLHEEIILWEPDNSSPSLKEIKGEFVIIVERSPDSNNTIHPSEEEIKAKLKEFVDFGLSGRDSVKKASKYLGISQKKIYTIYLKEFVKKD
ncbi:MAG: hypothetical protein VX590_02345, partial [Chloroflexota bacterium]|nr:hypothetical protein [Chloroflexota bacterium]